jgi:copper chaperone CopZ
MRSLCAGTVLVLVASLVQAGDGKKGEINGPHICCGNCEKSVQAILAKVDGISDVQCDRKNKTVTFTARDKTAAQKALDAMFEGGFAGTGKYDNVSFGRASSSTAGKADTITVKGVHACCGQCHKALKALFPDATVTIAGSGAQRDITIAGKDLSAAEVQQKLQKAGFSGKIEK